MFFTTTVDDHLHPDGSRKKVALGPGGIEDTAVSDGAPLWFHAKAVTRVPQREPHFFWDKKYPADSPSAAKRGGISDGTPDFMRANKKVATLKSTMKQSNQWHFKWKRPKETLRFDKDSAVSKEAPSFFHIRGVPTSMGVGGGLAYDYGVGKWDVGRVRTGDTRPRTSASSANRLNRRSRSRGSRRAQTPQPNVAPAPSRCEVVRKLRAEIAAQKNINRQLLKREITQLETLLQSQRDRRP